MDKTDQDEQQQQQQQLPPTGDLSQDAELLPPATGTAGVTGKLMSRLGEQAFLFHSIDEGKRKTILWFEPRQLKLSSVQSMMRRFKFGQVFRFKDFHDFSSVLNGKWVGLGSPPPPPPPSLNPDCFSDGVERSQLIGDVTTFEELVVQAQPDRVLGYVQNQSLVSGPLSALVEVYEHITVTGTAVHGPH